MEENRKNNSAPKATKPAIPKMVRQFAVMLASLLVMWSIAWLAVQAMQMDKKVDASSPATPGSTTSTSNVADSQAEEVVDNLPANGVGPVQGRLVDELHYPFLALPETGRVDQSYFDTVTFVGESITQGFQDYRMLPNAKYCAYRGVPITSFFDGQLVDNYNGDKVLPLDELKNSMPKNVYILAGTNSMINMEDDALIANYSKMLDAFRASLGPDVHFYVQSITPVGEVNDPGFTKERVAGLNARLAKLAFEKGAYYLNLHEILAGEDGYLKPEYNTGYDGLHMTPEAYNVWTEYLITHTAYQMDTPYLPGTPFYISPKNVETIQ